mgnify:CR=1 FL=1
MVKFQFILIAILLIGVVSLGGCKKAETNLETNIKVEQGEGAEVEVGVGTGVTECAL